MIEKAICIRPSDLDVRVQFPDGSERKINLLRMLVATQNAEFKRDHGMFLPGVNKLRPTLTQMREEFCIAEEWSKTWAQLADTMRECYDALSAERSEALAQWKAENEPDTDDAVPVRRATDDPNYNEAEQQEAEQ